MKIAFMSSRGGLAAVALCLLAVGCSKRSPPQPPARYDRFVISAEEIAAAQQTTALELVRYLRPRWLESRGQDGFRGVTSLVVYVNGTRTQGLDQLTRTRVGDLREIRYLDAIAATQRFGTGHGAGAILVILR